MGIVNVTPDSFSDGGRYLDRRRGRRARPGAGGRRRRRARRRRGVDPPGRRAGRRGRGAAPGRSRSSSRLAAEAGRAGEHRHAARRRWPPPRSTPARRSSTTSPPVAPIPTCSTSWPTPAPGYVVMHMQGEPRTMQHDPAYDDVVAEVGDFLVARLAARARRGHRRRRRLCADPGIGFGKTGRAQPRRCSRASRELVDARRRARARRDRRARRSSADVLRIGAPTVARRARRRARSPTAVWALDHGARDRPGARRARRSPTRSGCST